MPGSNLLFYFSFRERARKERRWQPPLWPPRSQRPSEWSTLSSKNAHATSASVETSSPREIWAVSSNGPSTSGFNVKRLSSRPVWRSPQQLTSSTQLLIDKQVGNANPGKKPSSFNRLWRARTEHPFGMESSPTVWTLVLFQVPWWVSV